MKLRIRRIFSAVLACILLTACTGGKGIKIKPASETETAEIGFSELLPALTHVFMGTDIPVEEAYWIEYRVDFSCTEEGRIRMCCIEREGERRNYIYEIGTDGSDPVMTEIRLPDAGICPVMGTFTKDKLVFIGSTWVAEEETYDYGIYIYTIADGNCTVIDGVEELETQNGAETILDLESDEAGYLYLITASDCIVLNPDGTRLFEQTFVSVYGIGRTEDGKAALLGNLDGNGKMVMKTVNPETKTFDHGPAIPSGASDQDLLFGPGYDLYYTDSEGLHGIRSGMTEMVLNWENSFLRRINVLGIWILSPGCVVIEQEDTESDEYRMLYSIYNKTDDIDPGQLRAVKLACVAREVSENRLKDAIHSFNRKNRSGIRVILMDYSVYNTPENPGGGETRLLNDILTGLYTPDIVAGTVDSRLLAAMIEKRMFTDLYTFMDEGDRVQKDDLFGCIRRTFEVDGELSALCRNFSVETLLAKKETVGDRTSWTLSEMLDLAESLDAEHHMMPGVTAENALDKLFGISSLNEFVDMKNMTCDFSSTTFVRMLAYIRSLENKTYVGSFEKTGKYWTYEGQQTGACMLFEWLMYGPYHLYYDRVPFLTPDVVRIGYPTAKGDGSGSVLSFYDMHYMIPKDAAYAEEAWEFISSYVGTESDSKTHYSVLKSLFHKQMEREEDHYYLFDIQNMGYGSIDKQKLAEYEIREDGTVVTKRGVSIIEAFSWETVEDFIVWLDTIGSPLAENIPLEVRDIVEEEISAYLGGARSAEETADIIQSRVSIWLAEHS